MHSVRLLIVVSTVTLVACGSSQGGADDPCGPKGELKRAGRVTGEAGKTGGKTAAEGVKTFGKSVGGLFSGGSDEAKKEWNEGSKKTSATAKEGAAGVKRESNSSPCE
jgi:hypothetical protein